MKYNKLVRDKIPERINNKGGSPLIHTATDKEYWEKLLEKLTEEVREFIQDKNEEELADVLEVIDAIIDYKKFDKKIILEKKEKKKDERGGFAKRIILDEVK